MTDVLIGNKKDNITVIYTPWSNLKKDGSMAVGQVGFKDPKKARHKLTTSPQRPSHSLTEVQVKKVHVPERVNAIVNRLNKTKVEKFPNLRQEKEDRQKELRHKDRAAQLARVRYTAADYRPYKKLTGHSPLSKRKRRVWRGSEKRRHGSEIMRTMTFSPKTR